MKKIFPLLLILLVFCALTFVFACSEDEKTPTPQPTPEVPTPQPTPEVPTPQPTPEVKYVVTFDVDGVIATDEVKEGEKVSKPLDPVKEGYTFLGWYLGAEELETLYDFEAIVTADVTLVAKFEEVIYTVTFDVDGSKEEVKVKYNGKAKKPVDPVKEGYKFIGWYLNESEYKFDTAITSNIDLVAIFEVIPVVTITGNQTCYVGGEIQLNAEIGAGSGDISWSSSDESILTVDENGKVIAKSVGTAVIIVTLNGYTFEYEIIVTEKPTITLTGTKECVINQVITLTAKLNNIEGDIIWSSSDETIAIVNEKGEVIGKSEGGCVITATCQDIYSEIEITVIKDDEKPRIRALDNKTRITINWNSDFDLLSNLTATDNIDGDITDKIIVTSEFDKTKYGSQTVTYSVEDSSGNVATFKRFFTVKWNYGVQFIGHAGSYYGLMNSEEAFLYAAEVLKYQLIECDLKQTSDGVFVMCHDDTFGGYTLASTTWDVLKNVTVTGSRSSGIPGQNGSVVKEKYTAGLCTLERYLEICKEYNVKAVIELKSSKGITNSDQSRMDDLMQVISDAGMLTNVVFLASQYNCLIWTRNNGYGYIPCQYLVGSCESETYLKRCIDYDLDISINVTASYTNSEEWLAKYKEAGLEISTYTYTQYVDYPVVQEWINKGVDYVTCDWHLMTKLDLPELDDPNAPTYKVTFKDEDGTILKEGTVKDGKTAASPNDPVKEGYKFIGWDKELTNIKEDTVFTAQYEIIEYLITYNSNLIVTNEVAWANKAEFVDEFYGDFFDWLKEKEPILNELTVSGSTYKFVKNGVTVTFSSVADIKAIGIYEFEKTLSNVIYKPVERLSDGSCIIYADENYFLNSGKYLEKYRDMDRWFYNCCVNNYSGYDRTYTPKSDGRIQIMFRFQQWQQGQSISSFNNLPVKYEVVSGDNESFEVIDAVNTYTVLTEVQLPVATGSKKFLGWSLTKDGTELITKIEKGTTENIVLYAIWE